MPTATMMVMQNVKCLPQKVTNDLEILMPVHWCLYHNHSCNRLFGPLFILDFRIFVVGQSSRVTSSKVRNESDILVTIACMSNTDRCIDARV